MVGGNLQEDNTEIWSRMVEAAGGPGVGQSVLQLSALITGLRPEIVKLTTLITC